MKLKSLNIFGLLLIILCPISNEEKIIFEKNKNIEKEVSTNETNLKKASKKNKN